MNGTQKARALESKNPKQEPEEEPELVTIDGLQFRPYQMQCMKVFAQIDGYNNNINVWLRDKILLDLLIPYSEVALEDYGTEVLEQLKKDGYGR